MHLLCTGERCNFCLERSLIRLIDLIDVVRYRRSVPARWILFLFWKMKEKVGRQAPTTVVMGSRIRAE